MWERGGTGINWVLEEREPEGRSLAMAVFKRGKKWWYKFVWNGELIRESTKQANKRIAEQMEAAHKASLAKGEVGIRDRAPVPTLKDFAERDFKPYIESRFQNKPKTLEYYRSGLKNLNGYAPLAGCPLDAITAERISGFVAKRREARLQVSSINRQLEVLRRMLKLAMEWGRIDKALPKIEMLPGENHRDRVLSADEEAAYLESATAIGEDILESYRRALEGIRATKRDETPIRTEDPFLLRDATTVLIDCGLRPEECFRLRWEHVRDGAVHIPFGKTENARRTIPLTPRASAVLEMRHTSAKNDLVFPAPTRSGHIEKSSLKKQHSKACKLAKVANFPLYTFRHTCLTKWAAFMDPYTLGYLAGHRDFSTTRRYVHPQAHTIVEAIERARNAQGGHKNRHSPATAIEEAKSLVAVIQ
jgi:integrase